MVRIIPIASRLFKASHRQLAFTPASSA